MSVSFRSLDIFEALLTLRNGRFDLTKIGEGGVNTVNGSFSFVTNKDFDCRLFEEWSAKGIFNHNCLRCISLNGTAPAIDCSLSVMESITAPMTSPPLLPSNSLLGSGLLTGSFSTISTIASITASAMTTSRIPTSASTTSQSQPTGTPNTPNATKKAGLSSGAWAGIALTISVITISIGALIWFFKFKRSPSQEEENLVPVVPAVPKEVSWLGPEKPEMQETLNMFNRNSERAHLYDQLRRLDDSARLRGGLDQVEEDRRTWLISEIEEGIQRC